jgi:DNA-binding LacI/PurR family transcriptional regulator
MVTRATIVDVARVAGVSVATASDAVNGKGRVAEATRARVRAVVTELGYRPRPGARGLAMGRTMTLGLRVGTGPTIPSGTFFLELLNGASAAAMARGYALLITNVELDEPAFVDGVLVVDPAVEEDVGRPLAGGLPVVTVGRTPGTAPLVPRVDSDHQAATTMLLSHLHARRPNGPAWLLGLPGDLSFSRDIEQAFLRWTARYSRGAHIVRCADEEVEVARAITAGLATLEPPTVVCSILDRQGAWAQRCLIAAGLRVPEDVLLASATDGVALEMSSPPITAVNPGGHETGRIAADLLIDRVERPDMAAASAEVLVEPRLMVRASTSARPHP